MANPNIVNVTEIYGKVSHLEATTSAQTLVENPAGSGKIIKINTVTAANIDGTNSVDVSCSLTDASAGTNGFIAYLVSVPGKSTLVVISKDTSIYLEEGDSLNITASAAGDCVVTVSYEEIS
jgi:hypothetical protein